MSALRFPQRFLLGVHFSCCPPPKLPLLVESALSSSLPTKIFTPNPEMLVKASRDPAFKNVLNAADINLCDGRGAELALRIAEMNQEERVYRQPGADFITTLCAEAEKIGVSIYLIGAADEATVSAAANELTSRFPLLKVAGFHPGPRITETATGLSYDAEEHAAVLADINAKRPAVLIVAFGMGKQEKWIHQFLPELPSVKIAIGVGGALDYLAGKVPRAPYFMRKIGFEWLFRLAYQPHRLVRIFNATAIFPFLVLKDFFTSSRKN